MKPVICYPPLPPPQKRVFYRVAELWHKFPNTIFILKAISWLQQENLVFFCSVVIRIQGLWCLVAALHCYLYNVMYYHERGSYNLECDGRNVMIFVLLHKGCKHLNENPYTGVVDCHLHPDSSFFHGQVLPQGRPWQKLQSWPVLPNKCPCLLPLCQSSSIPPPSSTLVTLTLCSPTSRDPKIHLWRLIYRLGF